MKSTFSKYFILIFVILTFSITAQQPPGNSTPASKDPGEKTRREIRKQERKEWKERRKLEREEQKAIKAYHKRIQTKTVLKRMKRSKRTAIMNNENKREFFLKRWFTKKKKR